MMVVNCNNVVKPKAIGNCEVVSSYIYLGSLVPDSGGSVDEIKRRIAITRSAMEKLSEIWRDRNITKATKTRLVRSLVFPVLLYGAETWTVRESERKRIDDLEMWCWRRMLRISWTQRRTNISILQEFKVTQRLSAIVHSRILRYFGHITRKEDDAMERLVVQGRVDGTRPRLRPSMRWTDQVKALTGSPLNLCGRNAVNREAWRETAKNAVQRPQ
ncbi:uncharacterized protein LOC134754758 [Cydia strobilella]|uniref:uncharacterized protein LOC134754758 n=1 Tax=Cydia strobilella TaxID=1100964 RepID=UPI00300417B5